MISLQTPMLSQQFPGLDQPFLSSQLRPEPGTLWAGDSQMQPLLSQLLTGGFFLVLTHFIQPRNGLSGEGDWL